MSAAAQRFCAVATTYRDVTRSRRYFPLWLGQLISSFGDTLHYIFLVVLVFQLTGRGVAVDGLVVAEIVPVLLLGPAAGVVIDRFSRKRVLIAADLLRSGTEGLPASSFGASRPLQPRRSVSSWLMLGPST